MSQILHINLGSIEQIPLGQGQCFIVQGQKIAVFRSREDQMFAIDDRCPHRGGPLSEGIIGNGKVVCPLHGHKFDLRSGQGGEVHECVRSFNIWQEEAQIVIEWPIETKLFFQKGDGL